MNCGENEQCNNRLSQYKMKLYADVLGFKILKYVFQLTNSHFTALSSKVHLRGFL